MKILVVSASPSREKSNTSLILKPFMEGMQAAGADVEVLYVRDLDIKPCQGEYTCWIKTPGECFQKDDMEKVLPKIESAEGLVFSMPLYVDGVPGPLKMFMDRLIPTAYPNIDLIDGHCRHKGRAKRETPGRFAFVSTCGFWELDNFDAMVAHMKAFCRNIQSTYCGALLRPHAGAMRPMMQMGLAMNEVFDAAKDAGTQFVRNGIISEKTLAVVGKELVTRDMYMQYANESFDKALAGLEQKSVRK
jgi:multimeric flavodoxin WrbA